MCIGHEDKKRSLSKVGADAFFPRYFPSVVQRAQGCRNHECGGQSVTAGSYVPGGLTSDSRLQNRLLTEAILQTSRPFSTLSSPAPTRGALSCFVLRVV